MKTIKKKNNLYHSFILCIIKHYSEFPIVARWLWAQGRALAADCRA